MQYPLKGIVIEWTSRIERDVKYLIQSASDSRQLFQI